MNIVKIIPVLSLFQKDSLFTARLGLLQTSRPETTLRIEKILWLGKCTDFMGFNKAPSTSEPFVLNSGVPFYFKGNVFEHKSEAHATFFARNLQEKLKRWEAQMLVSGAIFQFYEDIDINSNMCLKFTTKSFLIEKLDLSMLQLHPVKDY